MNNCFHKFFNPHCPRCADDKICQSCETLKIQVERLIHENTKLLDRILEKPVVEARSTPTEIPIPPRNIPWNVRRQMLEAEDRERAKLMNQAPKPSSTDDLEKELKIAEEKRERIESFS
jgi:hypothetical protein